VLFAVAQRLSLNFSLPVGCRSCLLLFHKGGARGNGARRLCSEFSGSIHIGKRREIVGS
jgi:hypothetical protein